MAITAKQRAANAKRRHMQRRAREAHAAAQRANAPEGAEAVAEDLQQAAGEPRRNPATQGHQKAGVLERQAMREGWPVPLEDRPDIIQHQIEIARNRDAPKQATAAFKALLAASIEDRRVQSGDATEVHNHVHVHADAAGMPEAITDSQALQLLEQLARDAAEEQAGEGGAGRQGAGGAGRLEGAAVAEPRLADEVA